MMTRILFRLGQFFRFYCSAVTKYQLHSPFVFELSEVVLDNKRWYYAFRDVEVLRRTMLASKAEMRLDDGRTRLSMMGSWMRGGSIGPGVGQQLFHLANWVNPRSLVQVGTSVGIGAMYLHSGAHGAACIALEERLERAGVARVNVDLLGCQSRVAIRVGRYEDTLPIALTTLQKIDFLYVEDHVWRAVEYFEECLPFSHDSTVFVFWEIHRSVEGEAAWQSIQRHRRVTLTVDFFGISLVFINPNFKHRQHFSVVAASWKIWKFM
jgi:predicted O-methyltransferase YrrM